MNSGNDDVHFRKRNYDDSKNLLKIQQLSELGLEFFDSDLDSGTLSLNLLNQDTSLMDESTSSKEAIPVEFSNLNDYVAEDIIATLSPEQEQLPIIEVLPTTDDIQMKPNEKNLPVENASGINYRNSIFSNKANETTLPRNSVFKVVNAVNGNNAKKPFLNLTINALPDKSKETSVKPQLKNIKIPNVRVRVVPKSEANSVFAAESERIKNANIKKDLFSKDLADSSDLDNKINDSLLDMLQDKIIGKSTSSVNNLRSLNKPQERSNEKEVSKFITIFPSKSTSKIINLMVKGKTCRSKQPLTDLELRIVTRILNQENMLQSKETSYRNVYYDTESDTNIRYEVKCDVSQEENVRSDVGLLKNKKGRPRNGQNSEENNQDASKNDEKYVLKSVARTRCGRVSRPPRHVIRDYKRLKHLTAHNSDAEDENAGGYADYQLIDDPNKQSAVNGKPKESENLLYGPLEPNKRQFSSLSLCPTCGKVYLGYRRMAIHFQKYPDHKNEELLKRLLDAKKKSFDESVLSDSSEINTNEQVLLNPSAAIRGNGAIKRKRKLCRKFKMPNKSNAASLKELLCVCGIDEIVKYAAPVVAGFLSSWEYLLIRSNKLKTKDETLAASLLKEINSVLKQIRSLSQCILKPYVENKENIVNKVVLEEEDVLRQVLGIDAGIYVASDNENWTKEFFRYTSCFQNNKADVEEASSNNSPAPENGTFLNTDNVEKSNATCEVSSLPVQSFFKIDDRSSFPTLDFSQSVQDELGLHSNSTLDSIVDLNPSEPSPSSSTYTKDNSDKPLILFRSLPNGSYEDTSNQLDETLSLNSLIGSKPKILNEESNSADFSSDFNKSYCSAGNLNFDSFVNDAHMMNDFPISLPLLSDNSSDSKDCLHLLQTSSTEDLLNSLKTIENSNESVMVELEGGMSSRLPLSANHTDNMSSAFNQTVDGNTSPCILDFESISSNFHCNDN